EGGPGRAALGTDALALLDHLGIARAAVVAQSMGGWAAVGAAVQAPQRFWAIVMANTVGNLTNPDIAAVRQRLVASSPPRPPELSKTGQQHVPGSRFERVEAAGHSTYFERPEVWNREVGAFLKAHRP